MSKQTNDAGQSTGSADPADAAFENLLRSALVARPQPEAPFDLAARAMKLARAAEFARLQRQTERLARQRWWAQVTGIAATLLITALLVGAVHRVWTRGDIAALTASSSSDSVDSTSSTSSTSSTDSADSDSSSSSIFSSMTGTVAVVFGGELLVLGIVLLTLSRNTASSPWGAEAVAGLW